MNVFNFKWCVVKPSYLSLYIILCSYLVVIRSVFDIPWKIRWNPGSKIDSFYSESHLSVVICLSDLIDYWTIFPYFTWTLWWIGGILCCFNQYCFENVVSWHCNYEEYSEYKDCWSALVWAKLKQFSGDAAQTSCCYSQLLRDLNFCK